MKIHVAVDEEKNKLKDRANDENKYSPDEIESAVRALARVL